MADDIQVEGTVNAKERFEKLDSMRDQVTDRARQAADITIPAMLPPEGNDENSTLPQPYQSLGARGVNNLTSKLRLSLFPPGQPFFRFLMENDTKDLIVGADPKAKVKVDKGLLDLENSAMEELEQGTESVILHSAIKQLVVVGNVLLHMPTEAMSRIFRLNNYVVVRDPTGNWYEIVAREEVHISTLPEDTRPLAETGTDGRKGDEIATIFTHVKKVGNKAEWYQSVNDKLVPGSEGKSDYDDCPYIPLRWSALENENYGRSHVEEYIGDLRSLEDISKSLVQWALAASKVIYLDRPNSSTDIEAIQDAESGDFVEGNEEDIGVLALEKFADFQVVKAQSDDITLRLSHAFLLQSGTVRNAERVTAVEIREMAQELEDALGGVYTVLAADLQPRVVRRLIARLKKKGKFPQLPKGAIKPIVVTGFDALGRGHELNKLRTYFADGVQIFGEVFLNEFDPGAVSEVLATQHNVDVSGLRKTDEQKTAELEQASQAQLVDKTAGPIAGAAAKGMADQINQ